MSAAPRDPEENVRTALRILGDGGPLPQELPKLRTRLHFMVRGHACQRSCGECKNLIPEELVAALRECPFCDAPFYEPTTAPAQPEQETNMSDPRKPLARRAEVIQMPPRPGVPAKPADGKEWTKGELEDATRTVLEIKLAYSEKSWEFAQALKDVRDTKKYSANYRSWEAWVETEVRVSPQWAGKLVRAAEEFEPKVFGVIGETNAVRLLRVAEPAARQKWARRLVDTPMTKRELDEALAKEEKKPTTTKGYHGKGGRPKTVVRLDEIAGKKFTVKLHNGAGEIKVAGGFALQVVVVKGKAEVTFQKPA